MSLHVSILIATRNRARLLERTLLHIAAQDAAHLSWEVIVVDNGSSDDTKCILSRMHSEVPLVRLEEPVPGKNRALNKALTVAEGDLLLFTDDDVIVDGQWMVEMQKASERWPQNTILAGAITPTFEADVPLWIKDPRFVYSRLVFCGFTPREGEGPIEERAFGSNFGLRRVTLGATPLCESVGPTGGRMAPMGSETSLFRTLEATGARTVFVPSAHVKHVITLDQVRTWKLMQRAFRAGRSDVLFAPRECSASTLWKRTAKPILRCAAACFQSRLAKVERGMDLSRALGRVYQRTVAGRRVSVVDSFVTDTSK